MQKVWKARKPEKAAQEKLAADLRISPFLAQLLINRGIAGLSEAENFLSAGMSGLHGPELLPDADKARSRIRKAISRNEKVLLFADYDADGLTSLALLKPVLEKFGLKSRHYLPHRLKEGYGLSGHSVKYARDNGFNLVITLDCGIGNFKEIEELRKSDIDVIVIDHHHLESPRLPLACAVINPRRPDSAYPFRDLAGVGVAFKFACYLLNDILEEELDLACLGTIADVVPLLGENRVIVREGLKRLNCTRRAGLRSLIEISGIKDKTINTEYVSYILGPRINACGRIDSAEAALKLLLSDCPEEADLLARELHLKNRQRQRIEADILAEALDRLENAEVDFARERVIVLHRDGWHQGVLGIVAAKVSSRFNRPAIIISFNDGIGKGSGRSIDTFHLFEGLKECKELLQGFGGHKKACGLSILEGDIEAFRKNINQVAWERLSPQDLLPGIDIDMELRLPDLNHGLLEEINLLEPFGQGNAKPLFYSSNLRVKSKPAILGKDTLKFWVTDGQGVYPAVGFGMGEYCNLAGSGRDLDIAYSLSLDNWNGNNQLQLEIKDIRLSLPCRP